MCQRLQHIVLCLQDVSGKTEKLLHHPIKSRVLLISLLFYSLFVFYVYLPEKKGFSLSFDQISHFSERVVCSSYTCVC